MGHWKKRLARPSLFDTFAPVLALAFLVASPAAAQFLPPHEPLRILIVSDEVNPHGLPDEDLTQPGELATTLLAVPGLQLDGTFAVLEISTDQIEQATVLLELSPDDPDAYDVLVYFSHRIPDGPNNQVRQEAFVTAVDGFLQAGGGVVSFHHGLYFTAGKESMQDLLGAQATGTVIWDEVDGQNVIATRPSHFVASYGVDYPSTVSYEDVTSGVPLGTYPVFTNTPDEQYPNVALLPAAGEVEVIFGSDYDAASHLLGYTKTRFDWTGAVVVYQPGEYQPNALSGNNLQILLNAIVWAAQYAEGDLIFGDGFESGTTELW